MRLRYNSLYHLEHFFCYLMEDVPLPPDLRHKVRLCFQEAVTNAVVHGNQYDENKYVHISLAQDTDKLILKIIPIAVLKWSNPF
ncbi:MAG: ATP-binding protein [Chitinophagales bacterium]